MANICLSLRTHLVAQTSITDLISNRMVFDVLAQKMALPAVTLRRVSTTHGHKIDGLSGDCVSRVTFQAFASTRTASSAIADAIRDELNGLRGTYTNIDILDVVFDSGPEDYTEAPQDGSASHRYITEVDFLVSYRE